MKEAILRFSVGTDDAAPHDEEHRKLAAAHKSESVMKWGHGYEHFNPRSEVRYADRELSACAK